MGSKYEEIRTNPSAGFQFCQLLVRSVDITTETPVCQEMGKPYSQAVHVPDMPTDTHKNSSGAGRRHMRPIQWHLK